MQVKSTKESDTGRLVYITATAQELDKIKQHVLTHFQDRVKVPGFRSGKIPASILEKHVDKKSLDQEFLEEAAQQLYLAALRKLDIKPVDKPEVTLKKFVPYNELEFEARIDVIGDIKLADYKNIKQKFEAAKVSEKEVKDVLESIRLQLAEKKEVERAAKDGDQVVIDFKGVEADSKKPIQGADGKDYPLNIGSNSFIPGFEDNLRGLKKGDTHKFDVSFPKNYSATSLRGKKATFTVDVKNVQAVKKPTLNDELAKKAGPFKKLSELKSDIKKRLEEEKNQRAVKEYESDLVRKISDKSTVAIPEVLINDQIERMLYDLRQNLIYRGQTMQEFLKSEGKSEEKYKDTVLKPEARNRVKAGLVLAEIADREDLSVSKAEVDEKISELKSQYNDEKMKAEIDKPETKKEIGSRILTEKTVTRIKEYASK